MQGGHSTPGRTAAGPRPDPGLQRRAGVEPDLQAVLAGAVRRLAETTGCERVAAWGRGGDGAPAVLAASLEGPSAARPSEETLAALAQLGGATDLGERHVPAALARLARERDLSLAAPVRAGSGDPVAFLLAGGSRDPAGAVRPRSLAALDATARRLALPVATALAAQRLRHLDEQVRRLDRLAALGELASEIAHEIRNPLVSVKTFLQLLPDRANDPEFRQSFFEVATEELRRVERLLDTVLAQARPGTGAPGERRAPPLELVRGVMRLVAQRAAQKDVDLRVDLPEAIPDVALGEDALRQVVLNLLMNAIDATRAGGKVRVSGRAEEAGVVLDVEDEGPGIPGELRERVFEPFFSTRQGKAGGLGLAISRRIAEEAGGSLSAHPGRSRGSLFRLRLPTR